MISELILTLTNTKHYQAESRVLFDLPHQHKASLSVCRSPVPHDGPCLAYPIKLTALHAIQVARCRHVV